ncbi:molybdate ABC transporter substrate-binding protein [Blastococcus montanus]|uniref:molybdate ABC transporter substrate-binding protein n=1 Tax=Blastococcus montanus TaxID=3144973 RepID=UPI003208A551
MRADRGIRARVTTMSAQRRAAILGTAALVLAGCSGAASSDAPGSSSGGELSGTLTVFAAASLTDVFTQLGDDLVADEPGLDIRFNFAGSTALAAQIEQGAPADVFASADEVQMARLTGAGLVEEPQVFAGNSLVLAVPTEDPGDVAVPPGERAPSSLAEIIDEGTTLAVCAPEVPCGRAAAEVLDAAGLSDAPDTYEDDVRAVLTKVQLGEVDAGLVYHSDLTAAGDGVDFYGFDEAVVTFNDYPVARLADAPNPDAARAFVDLVLSSEGQEALLRAGFVVR